MSSASRDLAILHGDGPPPSRRAARRQRRHVLEDVAMMGGTDAANGTDAGEDLFTGIKAEIVKLLDRFKSGELDAAAVGDKVCDYLQAHSDLVGDDEDELEEDEDGDKITEGSDLEDDGTKGGSKKARRVKESELRQLRREKAVHELCESLDYAATTSEARVLLRMASGQDRRKKILAWKKAKAGRRVTLPHDHRKTDASNATEDLAALRGS